MVRRVGFGTSQDREQARNEDKARAERIAEHQGKTAPTRTRPTARKPRPPINLLANASKGPKIILFIFLSFWLSGWTLGIIIAIGAFGRSDEIFTKIFMFVWLTLAIIGWLFVVKVLINILRGKHR